MSSTAKSATNEPNAGPAAEVPLCDPPCLHADTPPALLDTILLDILLFLPPRDLAKARAVCRHWHSLITTRQLLRARCFLPTLLPLLSASWELHPVLRMIDYWGYSLHIPGPPQEGVEERTCFKRQPLKTLPMAAAMASAPAVRELGVWLAGSVRWLRCEGGISVWALMQEFDAFIQERRYHSESGEEGQRFIWDHKVFPLAGFRVLPGIRNAAESRLVVTPEFFDTTTIVSELRVCGWVKEPVGVPFCFELPPDAN